MLTMSQGGSSEDDFDCRLSDSEYNWRDEESDVDDSRPSSVQSRIKSSEGASPQPGLSGEKPTKRPRSTDLPL